MPCACSAQRPGGGEIAERLADAGAGLRQHHARPPLGHARREGFGGGSGIGALAGAGLGARAGELAEFGHRRGLADRHAARLRSGRDLLPFGELGEQPAFGTLGRGQPRDDRLRPRPAQPDQRVRDVPGAVLRRPVALDGGEQRVGAGEQRAGCGRIVLRSASMPSARARPAGVGTAKRAG